MTPSIYKCGVFTLFLFTTSAFSLTPVPAAYTGTKLPDYQKALSEVFIDAKDFREVSVTPQQLGGTTFMGLVVRLLGERPDRSFESMEVPRVIYEAYFKKEMQGLAHGVSTEMPNGLASVFVFYDMEGVIKKLRIDGIPENISKLLQDGGYLQQFVGYKVEDFEKQARYKRRRGRKQSYWEKGKFLVEARAPASPQLKPYWEKIVRSVRFNAAFMDVAFFITRHPELDNHERISNLAVSGPEKEVEDARIEIPDNNQSMILKPVEKPKD